MGLFSRMRGKGIDEYAAEAVELGIPIVDVREAGEFAQGHIPGAVNIPLGEINRIQQIVKDKSAPVYVHCLSGGRSARAVKQLASMGYSNVTNIGGIGSYGGPIEK